MLVTFSCKVHANITMFGDVALTLLTMMGRSKTIPSAMMADEVPDALAKLQQALHKIPQQLDSVHTEPQDVAVSLSHRALPLIELLQDAIKHHCNVMWK